MPVIEFEDKTRVDFNPNHSASNGQFASKGGGGSSLTAGERQVAKMTGTENMTAYSGPSKVAKPLVGDPKVALAHGSKNGNEYKTSIAKKTGIPESHIGVFKSREMADNFVYGSSTGGTQGAKNTSLMKHPLSQHTVAITNRFTPTLAKLGFEALGFSDK